ncbi:MAG: ABC transporter ATP-binding protein [Lachnospiraceae bacterium]|nr:ABC transporter ATP-binding protein [Lachnospiraceae bacterium]
MSFLRLSNIGKIYVSEGNVAVGIRGVNLAFEKGEFVAITGASGSGKSTLLNVISGMDTYEEGELYIEEQPTSHYLQPDWEQYRQDYISFIFQDYNIIDSFTVLQNVELALMSVADPIARRKRAVELIERVGLSKHMRHKGSQLSGGQKQRTVIARALAKDSPIILADEPTGNLDSETSKEIVALLREVSKDKLLIMVTHNFDQVEDVATRHIRVYDSAIESDRMIREPESVEKSESEEEKPKKSRFSTLSNGFLLGRSIFTSKPHLSLFLCLLMIIGAFGIFIATVLCGNFMVMFRKAYVFRQTDGRVVVTHQDGSAFTQEELDKITSDYNAIKGIRYDYMMDVRIRGLNTPGYSEMVEYWGVYYCTAEGDYGTPDIGRYPEKADEVFMYLPYYYLDMYGENEIHYPTLTIGNTDFTIVGIRYTPDNTQPAVALFTDEGLQMATAAYGLRDGSTQIELEIDGNRVNLEDSRYYVIVSAAMDPDKIYLVDKSAAPLISAAKNVKLTFNPNFSFGSSGRDEYYGEYDMYTGIYYDDFTDSWDMSKSKEISFGRERFSDTYLPQVHASVLKLPAIYVGTNVAKELLNLSIGDSYSQVSLMFSSNRQAKKAAAAMTKDGYLAVTTDETFKPDALTRIEMIIVGFMNLVLWVLFIVFIAFFVNLCSHRTILAFKEDLSIMRSMGIPVKVIRIGIYVRMFLALIPAFVLLPICAYFLFRDPDWNSRLSYFKSWQYVALYLGLILLTIRVTGKQIKGLFGTSVKKALRGGEEV